MAYSDVEKEIRWRRKAKGRGLRWMILRDIVAILSRRPLTSMEVQDLMILLRGISHKKSLELLEELKQAKALEQVRERDAFYWRATEIGVIAYLGTRQDTPAKVAEELLTLTGALALEE